MRTSAPALKSVFDQTDKVVLLRRAQEGDETACREIIEKYGRLVRYWVQKMFDDTASIEDSCQEVWMRFFRGLPHLHPGSAVPAYLKTITRNASVDYSRSRQARQDTVLNFSSLTTKEGEYDVPLMAEDCMAEMQRSDIHELVWRQVTLLLNPLDLEIFSLVLVCGKKHRTAAARLKISTKTISRRCGSILERLRGSPALLRAYEDMLD